MKKGLKKYSQLQIGKDIRVKFQTSPRAYLNLRAADENLRLEGELGMPLRTHYGLFRSPSGSLFPNKDSAIIRKNGLSVFYPLKMGAVYIPYYKK